jgi:hypothetical protein|tara:strand:+ start:884 stop:2002 length:1119 start_codon:yes stop_codon:yes gene_type:complete
MGFLDNKTDQSYYAGSQNFTWNTGDDQNFTITTIDPMPTSVSDFFVYKNGIVVDSTNYSYNSSSKVLTFINSYVFANNDIVTVELRLKLYGDYRYITLSDVVNNFMFSYVGDGKIINKANRRDVLFHTKRGIQEFAYDITKVEKIQEIEVGPTLSVPMPKDFISMIGVCWVDNAGVEHPIPKGSITSKPSEALAQDDEFNYTYDNSGNLIKTTSVTNERFKEFNNEELTHAFGNDDYFYNQDFPAERLLEQGKRYGGDPSLMNRNGIYIIDQYKGTINFSSELNAKLVNIKYVSDSMGSDAEMKVHKFAEEAIYKYVAFGILSTMANIPEYIVGRYKRDKRAAMRHAKLRLYEINLPEITQVLRGKSKHIKH